MATASPSSTDSKHGWLYSLSKLVLVLLFVIVPIMKICDFPPLFGVGAPPSSAMPGFTNPFPNGTGGSSGGGSNGTGTASPTPSAAADPRTAFMVEASASTIGTELQSQGYQPAAVYELAPGGSLPGSNGQVSQWLNGYSRRTGDTAYVLLRSHDAVPLVSEPTPGVKPDRVVMVNSNTEDAGKKVLAYAQDFGDNRGTVCYVDSANKLDLSDPNIWYMLNKLTAVRGSSTGSGTSITVTRADAGAEKFIPAGDEIKCMTYDWRQEEIESQN